LAEAAAQAADAADRSRQGVRDVLAGGRASGFALERFGPYITPKATAKAKPFFVNMQKDIDYTAPMSDRIGGAADRRRLTSLRALARTVRRRGMVRLCCPSW